MTTAEGYALLMVLVTAGLAGVGWLVRRSYAGVIRWARIEDDIKNLRADVATLIARQDADLDRLTRLERSELEFWRQAAARKPANGHAGD